MPRIWISSGFGTFGSRNRHGSGKHMKIISHKTIFGQQEVYVPKGHVQGSLMKDISSWRH